MTLTASDWHARFSQQARWTQDLRRYLYRRAGLQSARRVLDVGCGTGVLVAELQDRTLLEPEPSGRAQNELYGLDIDPDRLRLAAGHAPTGHFVQGDAHALPFPGKVFDLTYCHFLLLWVADPELAAGEMRRVTRAGGAVLALAEPDYGGRVDYPPELAQLGEWQQAALRSQGADPQIGRRLGAIFSRAGLRNIETGVLGGQWAGPPSETDRETEWAVLEADLSASVPPESLQRLRALDEAAWQRGERVLFVPTFYAWGQV